MSKRPIPYLMILRGPWKDAGGGLLKRRIVLAELKPNREWVTWGQAVNKDGRIYNYWGHYFTRGDDESAGEALARAVDDYNTRVKEQT